MHSGMATILSLRNCYISESDFAKPDIESLLNGRHVGEQPASVPRGSAVPKLSAFADPSNVWRQHRRVLVLNAELAAEAALI